MTPERYAIIGLSVVLLAVLVIGGFSYLQEAKARAALDAELKAENGQLADLNARMAASDKQAQATLAARQAAAAKVKTPAQAIAALPTVVGLPKPIILQGPETTVAMVPGDAILPKADILPLFQKLENCKEHDILLGECQIDRQTLRTETDLLTKERDQAVSTVKGGTFWTRFKHNAKWVAVVAGTGFAAYEAGRLHH